MLTAEKKRRIFGWAMYDWANSAYMTTVAVAVLPAYFAGVVVPEGGVSLAGTRVQATSLWGYGVSLSALVIFLLAPFLGAAADYSGRKKRSLMASCLLGSLAAMLLFFSGPGLVWYTLGLFMLAQVCFTAGNVFYDSFLPHIAEPEEQDRVSGKGFALGYLGGGLQFALSLVLITLHKKLGLSADQAARIAMAGAGLWWGGFALVTFARLKEPQAAQGDGRALGPGAMLRMGFQRVAAHTKGLARNKPLLVFLIAFLFYNDGIQTVISMATIYGKQELGFSTTTLMLTLLMIQFVGIFGALAFSRLAGRITARRAIMLALVLWTGVVVYAFFLTRPWEYYVLGGVVGLVLGGSQALSRSLYASMIPKENSAEYFGYFSVVFKFSSIIGPLVFALVTQVTGSSRGAILSLVIFFVIGLVLLGLLGQVLKREGGRGV